jgi:hypothetical protein
MTLTISLRSRPASNGGDRITHQSETNDASRTEAKDWTNDLPFKRNCAVLLRFKLAETPETGFEIARRDSLGKKNGGGGHMSFANATALKALLPEYAGRNHIQSFRSTCTFQNECMDVKKGWFAWTLGGLPRYSATGKDEDGRSPKLAGTTIVEGI